MTREEARMKIQRILMAEIDRLPSHYDSEVDDLVFDDTNQVDELLELNKIVSRALEMQTPKKPTDNIERQCFECPTCGRIIVTYCNGKRHHCECGQAIDWSDIE